MLIAGAGLDALPAGGGLTAGEELAPGVADAFGGVLCAGPGAAEEAPAAGALVAGAAALEPVVVLLVVPQP
jgi:hypothetical protein